MPVHFLATILLPAGLPSLAYFKNNKSLSFEDARSTAPALLLLWDVLFPSEHPEIPDPDAWVEHNDEAEGDEAGKSWVTLGHCLYAVESGRVVQ